MEKYYKQGEVTFVVHYERRNVYIGAGGLLSDLAAEMICYKVMEPLGWEPNERFRIMTVQDEEVVGFGYDVPIFTNPVDEVEKLF